MNTRVKGHWSRRGRKRYFVKAHRMKVNSRIHRKHERRLKREVRIIRSQMRRRKRR